MNILQLLANRKLHGRLTFQGLKISVENAPGTLREGKDQKTGKAWRTLMQIPYGYILGSKGVDGDQVDCYVGPSPFARTAYVIHQNDPHTGKYDEDKTMLGFDDPESAKQAYLAHYDNPKFFGSMDEIPMDKFKEKVMSTKDQPKKIAASTELERVYDYYCSAATVPNSSTIQSRVLTPKIRKKLKRSTFVFPKTKKYPIPDANHGRVAKSYVSRYGSPAEKAKVNNAVKKKFGFSAGDSGGT